ncbi:sodium:proton antiporter [Caballeronia sp. LZ035]|uniref:cation:proton antiporter n=1 Tax=Caballeronia sp. LZ035 TaxID=3038568 RepID=UPI00285ADB88|nr:sodium:proton antiporter [Caballeronia sp. LZ035]MDR5763047.1 sodium:proton antiporter [Caballeronia sp. LZ035]
MLDLVAVCLTFTAIFAYLNHRYVGLPTTIGVMAASLGLSLLLLGLDVFAPVEFAHRVRLAQTNLIGSLDFSDLLLQGMLSLLLFAGAMHVDFSELARHKAPVLALAVASTVASTGIIGVTMHWLLPWLGITVPFAYCLLFGALISPTDPIAVMGILRSAKTPRSLETVITGESLFNDGVGVVLFSLLLSFAASGDAPSVNTGVTLLVREGLGGLAFGWVIGYTLYRLLASIDQYHVEVLLTLAAVIGGYALAIHLDVSGPLAMVVAGVMTGNRSRRHAMSDTTRRYVDMFWEIVDEILNALLFVLIGMEVLSIAFSQKLIFAGVTAAIVTLLSRLLTVGLPVALAGRRAELPSGAWKILTLGGLRGGISVALALSIPSDNARNTLLAMTYIVVVISILGQGLTIGPLARVAVRSRD